MTICNFLVHSHFPSFLEIICWLKGLSANRNMELATFCNTFDFLWQRSCLKNGCGYFIYISLNRKCNYSCVLLAIKMSSVYLGLKYKSTTVKHYLLVGITNLSFNLSQVTVGPTVPTIIFQHN